MRYRELPAWAKEQQGELIELVVLFLAVVAIFFGRRRP